MAESDQECLQCGLTRAVVKANNYYCATVSYEGECQDAWDRHRWADWSDARLAALGIFPEFMHLYRRHNERDLLEFVNCAHRGQEHHPGNPAEDDCDPPAYICVCCWADLRKEVGAGE